MYYDKSHKYMSLLVSLIPPSCIVVSKRKFVNITSQTHISIISNSNDFKVVFKDVNMETPRDKSLNSSTNNSRKSSTHFNVFSISYYIRMEV